MSHTGSLSSQRYFCQCWLTLSSCFFLQKACTKKTLSFSFSFSFSWWALTTCLVMAFVQTAENSGFVVLWYSLTGFFWVCLLMILYLFLKFWLDRLLLLCFIQYILAMVVGRRCLLKLNFDNTSHKSCRFTWHPSHVETDWLPLPNILLLQPLSFTIFSACYS